MNVYESFKICFLRLLLLTITWKAKSSEFTQSNLWCRYNIAKSLFMCIMERFWSFKKTIENFALKFQFLIRFNMTSMIKQKSIRIEIEILNENSVENIFDVYWLLHFAFRVNQSKLEVRPKLQLFSSSIFDKRYGVYVLILVANYKMHCY